MPTTARGRAVAIDPTKPIRPASHYAGRRHPAGGGAGGGAGGDRSTEFSETDAEGGHPPAAAVIRDPAVEIDGSLFEHLQQVSQEEDQAAAHAQENPYPETGASIWDLRATVRMLALDLDMLLTRLFGVEEKAAHDVAFSVIQAFEREMRLWHAQPHHRYLTSARTALLVDSRGGIRTSIGVKSLERGDVTILGGVPVERCRPGLHHHGDSHHWVRIEAVIHEIRARLGHIDFRRLHPGRTEAGASRGLHSAFMMHADGSRRGIQETEPSCLIIDTVTGLVAKGSADAAASGVHVDI